MQQQLQQRSTQQQLASTFVARWCLERRTGTGARRTQGQHVISLPENIFKRQRRQLWALALHMKTSEREAVCVNGRHVVIPVRGLHGGSSAAKASTEGVGPRKFAHKDSIVVGLCLVLFLSITWLVFVHRMYINVETEAPEDSLNGRGV